MITTTKTCYNCGGGPTETLTLTVPYLEVNTSSVVVPVGFGGNVTGGGNSTVGGTGNGTRAQMNMGVGELRLGLRWSAAVGLVCVLGFAFLVL
jgi:hypothetical protein